MFNRNQLKYFMMMLMVTDHIWPFISIESAAFFHIITRCVAVFFAYMSVEAITHTRNKNKYLIHLWVAGILMQITNILMNKYVLFNPWIGFAPYEIKNNIFLTLAIGATIVYLLSKVKTVSSDIKNVSIFILIIILGMLSLFTEGGFLILPFMIICYLFNDNHKVRNGLLVSLSVILFLNTFLSNGGWYMSLLTLAQNSNFLFISIVPILRLYNGEKGKTSKFTKYIFYVFYPLHLYTIALIATFLI